MTAKSCIARYIPVNKIDNISLCYPLQNVWIDVQITQLLHGLGLLIHLVHVSDVQYLLQIVLVVYGTKVYIATTLTLNPTKFFYIARLWFQTTQRLHF